MDDADTRTPSCEDAQDVQEALALPDVPTAAAAQASSAGALLRTYREESGMEQETLAAALKVSPQKLQALESDDYSALPALYFARGLAANICRHLEKDPAPVLALMPDEKPRIPAAEKTDATVRVHPMSPVSIGPGSGSGMLKWLVAGAILLALIAGAVFALPQLRARLAGPENAASGVPATTAAEPSTAMPQLAVEPASAAASSAPLTLQPATLQPAAAGASAASAAHSATQAPNALHIHANGDSWIKVTTAKGKRLFERSLKAGDTHTLSVAAYPVRVSVGKAENIQLIDRGQPVDLGSVASSGMTRVELKP